MKVFIISSLLVLLTACASDIDVYESRQPHFKMTTFFNGKLCAWGVVRQRNGEVSRKFVADINASSSAETVLLDENFLFNDGEKQTRVWKFERREHKWFGTAGDVVGEAIGEIVGDTLHLNYQLNIQTDNDTIIVSMDDWLHLVDSKMLMGSTEMSKWGLNVGRIDIAIQKSDLDNCFEKELYL